MTGPPFSPSCGGGGGGRGGRELERDGGGDGGEDFPPSLSSSSTDARRDRTFSPASPFRVREGNLFRPAAPALGGSRRGEGAEAGGAGGGGTAAVVFAATPPPPAPPPPAPPALLLCPASRSKPARSPASERHESSEWRGRAARRSIALQEVRSE